MNYKKRVLVMYVFLPMLILSFTIPTLSLIVNNNVESSDFDMPTLASVGLISRDTSDIIHNVHLSAYTAFDAYNDMWGDGSTSYNSPIDITTKVNNYATVSNLKTQLTYLDRMQVTSHGSITNSGPEVDLYGSIDFAPDTSASWRSPYGSCRLIILASCFSMGNGVENVALADSIKDNTNVKNVIGFNGEVDVVSAIILTMNFWYKHIAGLRTSTNYGGYSGAASFSVAESLLESLIDDIETTVHAIEVLLFGIYFFEALAEGLASFGWNLLQGALEEIFSITITVIELNILRVWMEDSLDAFTILTDGEYVSSMTPIGEGAGGGWPYKDITPD